MRKPAILDLIIGNLFKKPATVEYPRKQTIIEPDFRGRHYADLTKCTGCTRCALECPADAIEMIQIPGGYAGIPRANVRRIYPLIDYNKCVYCYRCVTVCPFNAYIYTSEYRLADSAKKLNSSELSLSTLSKK